MPAVFVHGNPETDAIWGPLFDTLQRDDLIALSLPGFGAPVPAGWKASGARVMVHGTLSSAIVQFNVDINVGDPLWPDPDEIEVPRLLGGPPIHLRGYRMELVLAEKIVTALQRGTANTRWRDFVDIAALARRDLDDGVLVESIRRVAAYRQAQIRLLEAILAEFPQVAQQRWAAWRRKQQLTDSTPAQFSALLDTVIAFADPFLLLGSQYSEPVPTTVDVSS